MTAEEIALQHGLCNCDKIYTSRGLKAPDCPWHAFAVEEAMDTFARQEAIGFNYWLTICEWKPRTTNEWCRYENGDIQVYTTEQLFGEFEKWKEDYKNQQQKQK